MATRSEDDKIEADVRDELYWDAALTSGRSQWSSATASSRSAAPSAPSRRGTRRSRQRGVWRTSSTWTTTSRVCLLDVHGCEDAELRGQVLQVLSWNMLVPPTVDADVDGGVVALRGTALEQFQREEAGTPVRNLHGVRDVRNEISLDRDPAVANVEDGIKGALERSARVDARKIEVESKGAPSRCAARSARGASTTPPSRRPGRPGGDGGRRPTDGRLPVLTPEALGATRALSLRPGR
jgi:osmotically-inducible protein OsmY